MVIQKILFSQEDKLEWKLFFRGVPQGRIGEKNGETFIKVSKGERLSTNTYFNSFSLDKWKKYTSIKDLTLNLRLQGDAEVRVLGVRKIFDKLQMEEVFRINETFQKEWLQIDITLKEEYINVYFEISAIDEVMFVGGYFSTSAEVKKDIKIGVDICTFNRYDYLEKNIAKLKSAMNEKDSLLHNKMEIFIVDNGNDNKTRQLVSENVHVFLQDAKGSAGGFTRGMLEITDRQAFTHCIVMDDDVYLYPEVLERLYCFLSFLKEDYDDALIGGALMRMDIPYIQHESGALWNAGNIVSCKASFDMRDFSNVVKNEIEEKTEYMGWWFCCISLVAIEKRGYPLPIYFHRDDVEFGLRNPKQITLNGICTWHEPFESKVAVVNEYYDMRNLGILLALYESKKQRTLYMKFVMKRVLVSLFRYRYDTAELILAGVEDFLQGPDWVTNKDSGVYYEELKGQALLKGNAESVEKHFEYDFRMANACEGKIQKCLRYIMLNGYFLKAKKTVIVPAYEPDTSFFWRAKKVCFYNEYTGECHVGQKSVANFLKVMKKLTSDLSKIYFGYTGVSKSWKEREKEHISGIYWRKKLEL